MISSNGFNFEAGSQPSIYIDFTAYDSKKKLSAEILAQAKAAGRHLNISFRNIKSLRDPGALFDHLDEVLKAAGGDVSFSFASQEIPDDFAAKLADYIARNSSIRKVEFLANCRMSEVGLKKLTAAIAKSTSLEELDLQGLPMSSAALKAFSSTLKSNTVLQSCSLHLGNAPEEFVVAKSVFVCNAVREQMGLPALQMQVAMPSRGDRRANPIRIGLIRDTVKAELEAAAIVDDKRNIAENPGYESDDSGAESDAPPKKELQYTMRRSQAAPNPQDAPRRFLNGIAIEPYGREQSLYFDCQFFNPEIVDLNEKELSELSGLQNHKISISFGNVALLQNPEALFAYLQQVVDKIGSNDLSISLDREIPDGFAKSLADFIVRNPALKEVKFFQTCLISQDASTNLVDAIAKKESLEVADLRGLKFEKTSIKQVAAMVKSNMVLKACNLPEVEPWLVTPLVEASFVSKVVRDKDHLGLSPLVIDAGEANFWNLTMPSTRIPEGRRADLRAEVDEICASYKKPPCPAVEFAGEAKHLSSGDKAKSGGKGCAIL